MSAMIATADFENSPSLAASMGLLRCIHGEKFPCCQCKSNRRWNDAATRSKMTYREFEETYTLLGEDEAIIPALKTAANDQLLVTLAAAARSGDAVAATAFADRLEEIGIERTSRYYWGVLVTATAKAADAKEPCSC